MIRHIRYGRIFVTKNNNYMKMKFIDKKRKYRVQLKSTIPYYIYQRLLKDDYEDSIIES